MPEWLLPRVGGKMTAEIALLNKSSIALAADSAATVASRDRQEKVFNTEDKLFELSLKQPIGIMIFNSTTFFETPVHVLIKRYRSFGREFETVDDAAKDFRIYLRDFARSLNENVREQAEKRLWSYPAQLVQQRVFKHVSEKAIAFDKKLDTVGTFQAITDNLQNLKQDDLRKEAAEFYNNTFDSAERAEFTGPAALNEITKTTKKLVKSKDHSTALVGSLIYKFLRSAVTSPSSTGFVIAGFAKNELLPSLRSFEVDGMIGDELRFMNSSSHDITLGGSSAKILPFAQQEMVERFVSSIDDRSEKKIIEKSRELLRDFRQGLLYILGVDDPSDIKRLEGILDNAEEKFVAALKEEGFKELKRKSQIEMEEMVEFMPKVDLAQMAESLVELTSIKRRVSRGFETVGGPIDVAVISRSEGFVWIKRKHYFPAELNARFFARVGLSRHMGNVDHGNDQHTPSVGDGSGGEAPGGRNQEGSARRSARKAVARPTRTPRSVSKRPADKSETDT